MVMQPRTPAPQPDPGIVVFQVRRDTRCAECGQELWPGSLLRVEREQALCLACADLDHLEFLPAGDAAITRRASKHSALRAVVVRWSRTRKRYERQGILAEPEAIRRAEEESLADAELRRRRQDQAAIRREDADRDYVLAFARAIRGAYPGCPAGDEEQIAAHACCKSSGRVGRSAAAKALDPAAIRLAVLAHVRHQHTLYDELLGRLGDREQARAAVRADVEAILQRWQMPAGTP
jgi:hypothetical protein